MPSGLIALLDDVATIAKLAASSLDDVAGAAGKAGTKAAGVVIDDTAVTPRYVVGLAPERELPIIGKIAIGSLKNKLIILLPAALLLTAFAPFLIVPLLMIGGSYLAFEATEKIAEVLLHDHQHEEQLVDAMADPKDLEALQVKGAIRTDFILSAEIIVITLGTVATATFAERLMVLVAIAIVMTVGVYGLVAGIVKLDDLGLHLSKKANGAVQAVGRVLLAAAPKLMKLLTVVGTAAMFMVGGGILLHGIPVLHHLVEAAGEHAGSVAVVGGVLSVLTTSAINAVAGIIAGGLVLLVVTLGGKLFKKK
jgi:uncharacterized protein